MASSATYALFLLLLAPAVASAAAESPTPAPWPLQFHSRLFVNYSGSLSLIDLWYDWTNGRNFNIIQDQLGSVLYDLEWNNGTSFFYSLDSTKQCSSAQLEVGILRPNWLDGAEYLGQETVDGFLCNVWQKVHFLWYYEDVVTKRPVHWVFYTGNVLILLLLFSSLISLVGVVDSIDFSSCCNNFMARKSINSEQNV